MKDNRRFYSFKIVLLVTTMYLFVDLSMDLIYKNVDLIYTIVNFATTYIPVILVYYFINKRSFKPINSDSLLIVSALSIVIKIILSIIASFIIILK